MLSKLVEVLLAALVEVPVPANAGAAHHMASASRIEKAHAKHAPRVNVSDFIEG